MPPFIQLRGWLRETEIGTSISEAPSLFFIPGDGTREGAAERLKAQPEKGVAVLLILPIICYTSRLLEVPYKPIHLFSRG